MARALRINAAELLRRPGSERHLAVDTTIAELGIADLGTADARFLPVEPVEVRLRLESLTNGLVVNGTITTRWVGICRRCAVPASGQLVADVHELYQEDITDPEAFELVGGQLDLAPMVREVIVLDTPTSPLCRPDCQGLCPLCGADRNAADCECDDVAPDPRWAALDELKSGLDS